METNKKVNQTRHPPNGLSIWSTGRCNEKKGPAHTTRISIIENAGPSNQILPQKQSGIQGARRKSTTKTTTTPMASRRLLPPSGWRGVIERSSLPPPHRFRFSSDGCDARTHKHTHTQNSVKKTRYKPVLRWLAAADPSKTKKNKQNKQKQITKKKSRKENETPKGHVTIQPLPVGGANPPISVVHYGAIAVSTFVDESTEATRYQRKKNRGEKNLKITKIEQKKTRGKAV